jgi:hypothetical protein
MKHSSANPVKTLGGIDSYTTSQDQFAVERYIRYNSDTISYCILKIIRSEKVSQSIYSKFNLQKVENSLIKLFQKTRVIPQFIRT